MREVLHRAEVDVGVVASQAAGLLHQGIVRLEAGVNESSGHGVPGAMVFGGWLILADIRGPPLFTFPKTL